MTEIRLMMDIRSAAAVAAPKHSTATLGWLADVHMHVHGIPVVTLSTASLVWARPGSSQEAHDVTTV